MNRDTGHILIILVGGAVIRIAGTDTYLRYVKHGLHVPLLAAGAVLVLLGAVSLWRDNPGNHRDRVDATVPEAPDGPDHDQAHSHSHSHSHGLRVAWLLLLPVFAIFLIAPPALGSYAAERATATRATPAAQPGDYPPLPAGDPVPIRLDEFEARAVWDGGRTLSGRQFRMLGFVTAKPGGGYYLTRIAIACCAADATSSRVLVTGAAGSYPNDTWVEVVGSYGGVDHSREAEVGPIAELRAGSVRQVPAPAEPYQT
ncbi:MAG: TIGR03943 family protein [Actinobacteria bacterium]|nr:TIGR03943 family protein [Actinomycetota bacterium]MBI3687778.1 TIGR03943 family protein [Actinomycetota bacterium]